MENKDKISIIIPCYNAAKYIGRCLESIINQTYGIDNIEIICIDDISTDNTKEIILRYSKQYPNSVIFVQNTEKRNCGGSRNAGLDIATGKYLMFVDSDDYIDVTMIQKMYLKSLEYNCDIVQCGRKNTSLDNDEGKVLGKDSYYDLSNEVTRKNIIINYYLVNVWARLYKKEWLDEYKIRFIENEYYEDISFTGIGFFECSSMYILNEELYFYYMNDESIMHQIFGEKHINSYRANMMFMENELKRLGKWSDVKEKYWNEYEYFVASVSYLGPFRMLDDYFDARARFFKDELKSRYEGIENNYYLNSLQMDLNKKLVEILHR